MLCLPLDMQHSLIRHCGTRSKKTLVGCILVDTLPPNLLQECWKKELRYIWQKKVPQKA